ncbi:MAG: VOC family protein [Candidatus Dormibacteraeota bacterium]|nr:VOC family protein [Candidatus Dormibacteraeota bacterium]
MPDYAPGTPSWVDLASPDLDASINFYTALFGWETRRTSDPAFGGYTTFTKDGQEVAGAAPKMGESQPTAWSSYVSTSDAEATAKAVTEAGGTVLAAPMEVPTQGHMAVFMDPTGAAIAVWQPGGHKGAELVNEPGSLSWNELQTRDPQAAKGFYTNVFGWGTRDTEMPGMGTYTEWLLDGKSIGGMMPMGDQIPASVPPHWEVYFAVADCDGTVAQAKELGATVVAGPMDIPQQGRFATMLDPQGAVFSVIKLSG